MSLGEMMGGGGAHLYVTLCSRKYGVTVFGSAVGQGLQHLKLPLTSSGSHQHSKHSFISSSATPIVLINCMFTILHMRVDILQQKCSLTRYLRACTCRHRCSSTTHSVDQLRVSDPAHAYRVGRHSPIQPFISNPKRIESQGAVSPSNTSVPTSIFHLSVSQ